LRMRPTHTNNVQPTAATNQNNCPRRMGSHAIQQDRSTGQRVNTGSDPHSYWRRSQCRHLG
jgi:hypothetical protein